MKRLIIIIVSLVSFFGAEELFGQQHYSMSEGNPEWIYYLQAHSDISFIFRKPRANTYITYKEDCFMRVYVSDTVLIEGKVLNKMMCEVLDINGNKIDSSGTVLKENPFLLALFREEDNKVFGGMSILDCRFTNHTPLDNEEHSSWANNLLFDFDLEIDDTLYRTMSYYYKKDPDYCFPVIAKQSISLCDGSKRYMTTYKSSSPFVKEIYSIEGIGFLNADSSPFGSLIDDRLEKIISHWCHLIMFKQNDKVIYIAPRKDPNAQVDESQTTFKEMPFYPDITPESVASGEYSFDSSIINSMVDSSQKEDYSRYNIGGQRINGLQKGLNIVDGKKIYIK